MLRILFLLVLASLMLPVNSRSIELAGRVTDQKDNPLEFYRFNIIKNKDRKNSFVDNELERL